MKNPILFIAALLFMLTWEATNVLAQDVKRNSIVFFEAVDQAVVYVNGKQVFSVSAYRGESIDETEFDLNPFLVGAEEYSVSVVAINAVCTSCVPNTWNIGFEVFQDGESVDYIFEEGASKQGGEMFSVEYDWGFI